jgi:hypothetical protein
MTQLGIIHLLSAIYLSGVICLAVSVNENDQPRRILRETLRRWVKFLGITLILAFVIAIMS